MDILSLIWKLYLSLSHNLPDHVLSFLIRANLLLACPVTVAFLGYMQGVRNQRALASLMAIGALAGLSIPIEFMLEPSAWRPWLLLTLILGCLFLPIVFAPRAHPHLGMHKKILKYTYIGLVVLFILNLFVGR